MDEKVKEHLNKNYDDIKIQILSFLYLKYIAASTAAENATNTTNVVDTWFDGNKYIDIDCYKCFNSHKEYIIRYCELKKNTLDDIKFQIFQNRTINEELFNDNFIETYEDGNGSGIFITQDGISKLKEHHNNYYGVDKSQFPIKIQDLNLTIIVNSIIGNNNKKNNITN